MFFSSLLPKINPCQIYIHKLIKNPLVGALIGLIWIILVNVKNIKIKDLKN
jgi:hypothetical protein